MIKLNRVILFFSAVFSIHGVILVPNIVRAEVGVRERAAVVSVVEDPRLTTQVLTARARFLATQNFERLDVTVLLRDSQGTWRRGSVGGDKLAYPASCVKLAYLVAAAHWCAAQGEVPECLDVHVRPMIVISDNVATGFVVDRLSGVLNVTDSAASGFDSWLAARRYTERVLNAQGLLGAQRLFNKTYPTNSSESPEGFEARARRDVGANAMSSNLAAQLMLAIVSAQIEPQATGYMRALLQRDRFSGDSAFGAGLPPGSILQNKIGVAFDTLEDIAWVQLPAGQQLIIAAFSNGWDQKEPEPRDVAKFSGFAEQLIKSLGLERSQPFHRSLSPDRSVRGSAVTTAKRWTLSVPRSGRYELTLWYDADAANTANAEFLVAHAAGQSMQSYNQQIWGRRWLPLGQFDFVRGRATVTASARSTGRLANAIIKISYVPP